MSMCIITYASFKLNRLVPSEEKTELPLASVQIKLCCVPLVNESSLIKIVNCRRQLAQGFNDQLNKFNKFNDWNQLLCKYSLS